MIEIDTPSGPVEAIVARPAQPGEWPGVLFFADAFGLRPQIEQMAQRIADWGYVVLAPNVFHRAGRVADLAPTVDLSTAEGRRHGLAKAMPRVRALVPAQSDPDTIAYVEALHSLDGVRPGPIGVTGYCMGARLATRAGGLLPQTVAVVGGFHGGGLVTEAADSPHLAIAASKARFCYLHADKDDSMPPAAVRALQAALDEAGRPIDSNEVFPGAPHGYTMADTVSFDPAAAERHYELLRASLALALDDQPSTN